MTTKNDRPSDRQDVHFVRGTKGLYPKSDEDYLALRQLRLPVAFITADFEPLLNTASKLHNLTFIIDSFTDLEQQMLEKVRSKWPFDVDITPRAVVLKAPKNIKQERLDKLVAALTRWYATHFFTLEVVSRKSSKSVKVTLTKRAKQ